jgi:hypothetical protein
LGEEVSQELCPFFYTNEKGKNYNYIRG